ncbi:serine hydrolase domain-containing protein [Pseudarthrobacter sp. P1]|uniref:serine hydrolase domain-containing protein n=1 Tax=Pseudarthrobacter sp. P1 TaxID=3418418 RepID=UPI003CEEBB61
MHGSLKSAAGTAALILALAGCSPASSPDGGSPGPSSSSTTAATSALLPFDAAALKVAFESGAKELLVPGAVMLLRTPAGSLTAAYGVRELGGTDPVTVDDHIRVGSNTKTWTGTVILQLVQEGKLRLSDPVSKYRPDVPNGEAITIEELMAMRSGLYNYSESLELNTALDDDPQRVWTPAELLALAFAQPPYFAPGTDYHYSNTNTVLLGLIAEQLDGKPLATIFQDRLFTPLHMAQTLFPASTNNDIPAPHPQGYMYSTNVLTMDNPALPEADQQAAAAGTLKPNNYTGANPSWAWAAGAGISTAGDLATWVEALAGGGLLDAALQKLRLDSPEPAGTGGAKYGLSIAKFGELYGHTGELPGFNSFMGNDPANQVTLVVWTNLAPAANGQDPASTIAKNLIGSIYKSAG